MRIRNILLAFLLLSILGCEKNINDSSGTENPATQQGINEAQLPPHVEEYIEKKSNKMYNTLQEKGIELDIEQKNVIKQETRNLINIALNEKGMTINGEEFKEYMKSQNKELWRKIFQEILTPEQTETFRGAKAQGRNNK